MEERYFFYWEVAGREYNVFDDFVQKKESTGAFMYRVPLLGEK